MRIMPAKHAGSGLALAALCVLLGAAVPAALAQPAPAQPAPASGRLTTHVLDAVSGKPGAGVRISFEAAQGEGWRMLKTVTTDADGRTDQPWLAGETMAAGRYRLVFHVGEDFARLKAARLARVAGPSVEVVA